MKNKGSVVIVTLWVLAILLLLAVGLAYRVGLELRMAHYTEDRLKTFYIARAGMERAAAVLLKEGSAGAIDYLGEEWSQEESLFKEFPVGEGLFSVTYATVEEGGRETKHHGMEDEESRIPLNRATAEILQRTPGMEEDLLLSIRAWRGDEDLSAEEIAREDNAYVTLGKPYSRKGKPFETIEELLLVKGMTSSLYDFMKRSYTVYGSGKVNLNTAPVQTLEQLGIDREIAHRISEIRKGEDGMWGTEDDRFFKNVSNLTSLETFALLGLDQDQQIALVNFLTASQDLLTVQSTAFRIQVEGRLSQGSARKRIVAVVDRSKEKGIIRYWHEE
ncbi:MAG: general secretion pathway protein GspK [Candidatus Omnitrophica bacterium]|nr:general secretion pathway protein GspK [Candidatus Omnitrophota bacterium]